jgi:hypothetical protein
MPRIVRRTFTLAALVAVALLLVVTVVNVRAPTRTGLLPPDPMRPITLPDGSSRPLIEIVSDIGAGRPAGQDIVDLAERRLRAGDVEQALALYQSVTEDHPRFAFCQRRIGWDILTRGRDEPSRGVAFVNASIAAAPFEGNAWQDAVRVYLSTLGVRRHDDDTHASDSPR